MQIRSGHFNFFQSIFSFNQTGRIVNAIYGAGFAYVAGIVLLVAGSWLKFQVIMAFLCEVTAGVSMLALMRTLRVKPWIATFSSILYMSSFMVNIWVINQSFTGWGAALLPFLLAASVGVVRNKTSDFNPVLLGTAMAILIMTHLFSTLLGFVAIIPFFAFALITNTKRLHLIKNIGASVIVAVVLSCSSLIAVMTVQGRNSLLPPYRSLQLLDSATTFSLADNNGAALGLVFSLLMIFQVLFTIFHWKQRSDQERLVTSVGAFFLLISTRLIPWDSLALHSDKVAGIQFPWRFVTIGLILLIAGFGQSLDDLTSESSHLSHLGPSIFGTIALFMVFSANSRVDGVARAWNTSNPGAAGNYANLLEKWTPDQIRVAFQNRDLTEGLAVVEKPTPDYLPVMNGKNPDTISGYTQYDKEFLQNKIRVSKTITKDSQLKLTWIAHESRQIQLPVVVYKGSTVFLNGHSVKASRLKTTDIGGLKVRERSGENSVVIGYQAGPLFKYALLVQLIGWLALLAGFVYKIWQYLLRRDQGISSAE